MHLLAALIAAILGTASARPPSVLLILCDDLGYGDLACFGNETIRTPNLDRLAAQGARLTACYAAAPVCSPSRAGILTGRTPDRCGVYDWIPDGHPMHLPAGEVTIASILRDAGYATAHVGKWHLNGRIGDPSQPQPADHGFDHWFSTQNNAVPSHRDPTNFVRNGEPVGPLEGFSCQIVADETIRWLTDHEARAPDQPFFAFVCFHEPHEPIDSPDDLVAAYPDATRRGEALYFANVTNMDAAVGRLMTALDDLGLADDTLVWFTSDNGPETLNRYRGAWRSHGSPGQLRGMKLHLHEGGIRVPGILRLPGRIEPGAVIDEPISGVDVLPTLAELAGAPVPGDRPIDGASALPALDGRAIDRRVPLHWHYARALGGPRAAIRVAGWVYLARTDADLPSGRLTPAMVDALRAARLTEGELYDLDADLSQNHDLVRTHADQAALMRTMLEQITADVHAESPPLPDG